MKGRKSAGDSRIEAGSARWSVRIILACWERAPRAKDLAEPVWGDPLPLYCNSPEE
jgi:hypothetical protein